MLMASIPSSEASASQAAACRFMATASPSNTCNPISNSGDGKQGTPGDVENSFKTVHVRAERHVVGKTPRTRTQQPQAALIGEHVGECRAKRFSRWWRRDDDAIDIVSQPLGNAAHVE